VYDDIVDSFKQDTFEAALPLGQVQRFRLDWNMTDFHQRLRQLRTARRVSRNRVAELLGVSPRGLRSLESGDATPLFGTVVKIADIPDVSLDELAGRKERTAMPTSATRSAPPVQKKSISFRMRTKRRW